MTAVHINIGNSDDKLSQARWAAFHADVDRAVQQTGSYPGGAVHGAWVSPSTSRWQNACWCLQLPDDPLAVEALRTYLSRLTDEYAQDSIAWTAGETEFISGKGRDLPLDDAGAEVRREPDAEVDAGGA